MTVMGVTIDYTDGYHQEYAGAYPDHTPIEAWTYMLAVLGSSGAQPVGDEAALTITTHTPTAQVVRTFAGGLA